MNDVIIIGAGVIGCSIAHALAKYDLSVKVIEKNNDVGDGASGANSAIVHSGYDPHPNTLKAELNVRGNAMFDEVCRDLDVRFERIGSITIALDSEEEDKLIALQKRATINGVKTEIINQAELRRIEPNITKKAIKGLLAPTAGIINPFEFVVALMENAMDNGVELLLNTEVKGIEKIQDNYIVKTNNGDFTTRYVINASGVNSDIINGYVNGETFKILPRKGEYFVLDHFDKNFIKHTLFGLPSDKGKGVLVSPTTHYNYLIGPSSEFVDDKEDVSTEQDILNLVKKQASNLVDNIPYGKVIRQFSGVRAYVKDDDFIIDEPKEGFINAAGIQSPGFASSLAIAEKIENMISKKITLKLKDNYNPKRRPLYRYNELSIEEKQKLIEIDPKFGHIICRCEEISEAEVIDCIKRNCGATTIKGVKKRVRPGFGQCQGGFCEPLVMKILVEQLGIKYTDVTYGKKGSYILLKETKGEKNE